MLLKQFKPQQALNKAFSKLKPNRTEIESFKSNLIILLNRTNDTETEEFHKNLVSDFFKKTYYDPNYFINTKGRNDLVIHNGNDTNSTVGVIIEVKKPTNKAEMITKDNLNKKAFQELVLYYLRERITHKNLEIKHLIATNIYEWFIFDENLFERLFAQNKSFVRQFENFEASKKTTDVFYKEIAEPFIDTITSEIEFTYFNFNDYYNPRFKLWAKDDNSLIALFKLLSPEHLLKLPFANDSNTLDKGFYNELLHIIGLTETQEAGKKLIVRNKTAERHAGTILEDAIIQLDSLDKLSRLQKPEQFGNTKDERLFNVALELSITWINRILFLKLLEAQLINYHKGDKSYAFLNLDKIKNYNALNSLFFQVLARKYEERNDDVKHLFEKVPYLNSSLFEPTELEHATIFISNLKDDNIIPIFSQTVLKDLQGRKRTGNINTLQYLFEFLDAYDFGAEGGSAIQEENKTLINASVLGLIFEKINGYKDGSFFTPGFITMYMCRETIRKAVIQKFAHDFPDYQINTIEDIYELIPQKISRKKANEIVNSLKICDPAVGSGHFLVSALNEIIAVKNDLKILEDKNGKSLHRYEIEVVNDELIVTDENGELFEYNPNSKESQRIQETLFHEKQTIIENCLFGVDINPNSVKICRLRLWIELLKNAYYKTDIAHGLNRGLWELETLPNIDINIKCGNSLVSRFPIDQSITHVFKRGSKWNMDTYKIAVATYRNAQSKEQKREMERLIADIKSDFRSEIAKNDPKLLRKRKLEGELFNLMNQTSVFEASQKEIKEREKKAEKLTEEIQKLEAEIEEIKSNKIYENAFEWRFEFPEVLNDDGDFVGFDVVIANPPYVSSKEIKETQKSVYATAYQTAKFQYDLFSLFIEKSVVLLRHQGISGLIIPDSFLARSSFKTIREYLYRNTLLTKLLHIDDIFDEASVGSCVCFFKKEVSRESQFIEYTKTQNIKSFISGQFQVKQIQYLTHEKINSFRLLFINGDELALLAKLFDNEYFVNHIHIWRGEEIGKKSDVILDSYLSEDAMPIISGEHIERYCFKGAIKFIQRKNILKDLARYEAQKIVIRQLGTRINATLSTNKEIATQSVYCLYSTSEYYTNELILAILNSKLIHFVYRSIFAEKQQFPRILIENINNMVLPKQNPVSFRAVESLVTNILSIKKQNPSANTTELENQIDQLVYQLYGLTDEEIAIIENSTKN
ncbi:type IIG restriction enzyme/methyltransferase [Rhodoflexus sp.]